jgi:hypothetical protein
MPPQAAGAGAGISRVGAGAGSSSRGPSLLHVGRSLLDPAYYGGDAEDEETTELERSLKSCWTSRWVGWERLEGLGDKRMGQLVITLLAPPHPSSPPTLFYCLLQWRAESRFYVVMRRCGQLAKRLHGIDLFEHVSRAVE